MATAEQYAEWIVNNAHRRGTPEFDTVAQAYQLAKQEGLKTVPAPAPSKERTTGEAFSDIGAQLKGGLGKLAQFPGQLYGLATGDFSETGLYGYGKEVEAAAEAAKSPGLKAREAARAAAVAEAEKTGQLAAAKTAIGETITDPALALGLLAENLPSMLLPAGAAAGVGRVALQKGLAKGVEAAAAREAAIQAGKTAAIRAGAVQQGADVGTESYEQVYKRLVSQGVSEPEAAAQAINLARAAGVSGAIISLLAQRLPGASKLEEVLAGKTTTAGLGRAALSSAAGEALGEVPEEVGGRFTQNLALRTVDPTQSLTAGLGEAGGMAALAGAGLGGIGGGISSVRGKRALAEEEARKPQEAVEPQPAIAEAPKPMTGEAGIVRPEEETPISREVTKAAEPEVAPPAPAEIQPIAEEAAVEPPPAEPVAMPAAEPEKPVGAAGMGQRMVNAANRFRDSAVEQFGLTPEQADMAMGKLMKEKVLSLDPVTGQYKLKDGRFWDREVLLRAAGETVTEPTAVQAAPVEEKPTAPVEAKRGAATRIIAGEEKIPAQWEVVEADSVKAAMTEGKTQPRDRKRAVSNAQIMSIAQNPDFDRLSDTSQTMDYGAPTLTQDGAIVGGNGRFDGVNLSYDTEAGQRYKQSLLENAERLGLDPEQVGAMQKPILVRRITQPADTRKLAIQSNIVAGLELSDMEQAALDAERMAGLDRLEISEAGDIPITSRNMDVLRSAFKDYTTEEMGKMMSAEGGLSQAGLRRVRNAILYKAYGKTDTLARLVESPDPDLKNVGTALMRASGGMSQMMDAIRSGAVPAEYDIIEDLTGAIETLSSLRASGTKVQEFLAQSELFGDGISGPARAILRFMDNNLRSAKSITEFLNDYAQAVLSAESATGGLFGEAQLPTKQETVERAAQKYEAQRAATKAQRTLEEQPAGEVRPEARVQPEGEGRAAVSDEEVKKSLRATPAQQVSDFEQTLRTALNRFGLKDVGVKLIDGMTEEGSYAQQLIRIAADSANPIRTLRHEAIHALRELGFFTPQQWQSLSKMAKDKWIDQYLKQRNVDGKPLKAGEESRYDAYMREYEGDMEKITEEAVADAFADFDATKPPAGLVSSLLTRLRNLFQAIKSALTNVESPEQIFGKVERGKLAAGAPERGKEAKSLRDRATANFLRWFGDSKVVDEKGEPLVMYHGTGADFSVFERSYGGAMGAGMYFTANPKEASEYAEGASGISLIVNENGEFVEGPEGFGNVMPVYLSIKNPYVVRSNKIPRMEDLQAQGYDGVVLSGHWVAFSPNQIKSAIGNNGEYSLTNADIRKSLRKEEPRTTPTTAGQSALDTINQLGMGVKETEGNLYEQAKKKFKAMGESPAGTKAEIKEAVRKFFANIETKTMSSDARWDSDIKNGLRQDMKPVEDIIGASLLASQSQAVGADAVSTRAMLIGGATYDEKAMKWVAYENKDANEVVKAKVLDEIAAKYGLTKEEASQVAHTYLVAANYEGIIKRNAKLEEQIKALKEEGKNDEADDLEAALVFVSEKQAAMVEPGKSIAGTIPEVKKIAEIWNEQRRMVKDAMVFSGLWRPEYADAMMDNAAYVPFYRETQIDADEGPRIFMRGLQVKAKEHKLKGSETAVNNVFENMAMWQQYAMNRAIRNHKAVQSIDVGKTIQVGDRKMAEQVKEPKRGMNVVKIWREGKQEFYEVADPYYVEAFQTLGAVYIEPIKYFTAISNILRKTVVMYPLFSIGQITQDSVAAIFASGLKPQYAFKIPYLAVKEFGKTMMGWSTTHDELKNYGAVGVRDFNAAVAREDAAITAGVKAPRGAWGKVNYMLERVAMSADNAVRQAMYIAATEAKLSKAEALEKAFEIINFRRRGSSKLLNLMGQTVPFFYAYLSAQRVAYKTLTLSGISPTERMAALETLAQTTAAVMALSFIYAMANGDDEEYKKTPSTIRDRSLMIPGSGGVRIPLRPDFFLFPKVIAEHTYQLLTDEGYSDGAKFRKSMADLLANATLSPNAVPQIIKPTFEAAINYSFFEGKPIVGFFEQNKEAGRQFNESTSEFAKWLGRFGASPQMVDHLVRGYFGSVGGLGLWGTNFFIEGEPGVPRPEITAHDMFVTMPGVGAFKQKPTENALKVDFYELRDAIAKVKNTYDDMKVRSPEGLEAFIQDEKNLARLAMDKQITKIGDHLSKIRRAIQQVAAAPESRMSASEKQERIKELRDVEMELLKAVDVKALRAQAKL